MTLPSARDWLFSVKTFAGAMAAVWIALRIGLDRPYWAMATAYIVAQPLTGAMRSKAVYRLFGTLLGLIATLALVPNLVDAPEVLTAALALWVGICIYFALLDRTPRSYVFLLAGYTAALVGFPSVDAPGSIWDVVIARAEEISLGIVCTTMIGTLVLPAPLGPALTARLDAWVRNAAAWTIGVLSGAPEDQRIAEARQLVARDAVEIGMLTTHLAFDTSNLQTATRPIAQLRHRVVLLLPVLSGVADRLGALREMGAISPALHGLLDRLSIWVGPGRPTDPALIGQLDAELAQTDGFRAEIDKLEPDIGAQTSWIAIIESGVLVRLRELVDLVHDIKALRRQITLGETHLPTLAVPANVGHLDEYRDHLMALYSAAASIIAVGLLSAWWIGTGWPDGAGAAALGAVAAAFFANQDNPVPSIVGFLFAATVALVLDAIYLFAILPQVHEFEMLMLALALAFLPLGAFAAMPAAARFCGPVLFLAATELALTNGYSGDFVSYVNASLAAIAGLTATAVIIGIIRSVSAQWTAERLLRRNRADIARAAESHDPDSRLHFLSLQLDRISLVVPRLAANANGDAASMAALTNLRVGVNVVDLHDDMETLSKAAREAVSVMLRALAEHYRAPTAQPAGAALLDDIDHAIEAVVIDPAKINRDTLLRLGGIRRALFGNASPTRRLVSPLPNPTPRGTTP